MTINYKYMVNICVLFVFTYYTYCKTVLYCIVCWVQASGGSGGSLGVASTFITPSDSCQPIVVGVSSGDSSRPLNSADSGNP